jgi:hypothetical protein
MTDASSARRTAALLIAWLAAAAAAGIPADAAGTADPNSRAAHVPVVQNAGRQCFAGHAARPAPSKNDD